MKNTSHPEARVAPEPTLEWSAGLVPEKDVRELSALCRQTDGCRNLDDSLLLACLEGQGERLWQPSWPAFLSLLTENGLGRVQLLVAPQARGAGAGTRLLQAALERSRQLGCQSAEVWAYGDQARTVCWLEKLGFQSQRQLFELCRPGLGSPPPGWPPGWSLRPFRPGDDAAWHDLHRRLQSDPARAWSRQTLRRQLMQPETPPRSFWLLWHDGVLKGYVWLKGGEPAEIFLFALAPETRGQGMGRRLLAWGLSQCSGAVSVFCDDQRPAALALYREAGFREIGRDRCLRLTL